MIHSFSNGKIASVEEYLFDATLHGKSFDFNCCLDLAKIPIKFDRKEVDAFVIDVVDDRLIVQLVLPLAEKFDDKTSVYKNSYIRNLINSDKFLSRFNKEFIEHIKPTVVHTEDYTTEDKLWLLSHEEVNQPVYFLKKNIGCNSFDLFKNFDMENYINYIRTLLDLNKQHCYAWRFRSEYSTTDRSSINNGVGCINHNGTVGCCDVDYADCNALCPACTIC